MNRFCQWAPCLLLVHLSACARDAGDVVEPDALATETMRDMPVTDPLLDGADEVAVAVPVAPSRAPERPRAPAIERIETVTGKSGATVWLIDEPSIPIIAVRMAWPGGEASDPDGLEGVTDLMAYMMNEGAGDLDSTSFAREMERLNMSFGCQTDPDWTSCTLRTLSRNADRAFELLRLALTATRFDEPVLRRAIRETTVRIRQRQTDPGWLMARAVDRALRPDHPYARFKTEKTIEAITAEDLLRRRDEVMTRRNMLISVVGDIGVGKFADLLDEVLAGLPPGDENPPRLPGEVVPNPALAEPVVEQLPRPQTLVGVFAPGPKRDHPDYIALDVLNHILGGGGFPSRMMRETREKRGLTYGTSARLGTYRQGALWSIQGETQNETAAVFIDLILAELRRLSEEGPTAKEVGDAISYITGAYPLNFDSNEIIAARMSAAQRYGLGSDYFTLYADLVEAVTLEDLRGLAAEWLDPNLFTLVLVGEPEPGAAATVERPSPE